MTDLIIDADGIARCAWAGDDTEYRRYHDEEWGTELRGDRALFEKMSLEGSKRDCRGSRSCASAALPRGVPRVRTVCRRRVRTRRRRPPAPGCRIIRHRGKIEAVIGNAALVADMADGELDALLCVVRSRRAHSSVVVRRGSGGDARVRGHEQRAATTRLPLRRPHHDVRAHAVVGHGRRPRRGVLASGRLTAPARLGSGALAPSVVERTGPLPAAFDLHGERMRHPAPSPIAAAASRHPEPPCARARRQETS